MKYLNGTGLGYFYQKIKAMLDGKAPLTHIEELQEEINKKAPMSHSHTWSEVTGKPSTFTPSTHNHDDRYYTETEIDAKLGDIDFSTLATKEQVGNLNYKALSQSEYDGLATKDANTIYFIYEDEA